MRITNCAVAAAFCSLIPISIALADEGNSGHSKAIEYRQSIMNIYGWNLKAMGAIVKGKIPYDPAAFAVYSSDLIAASNLNLLSGFPEDSDEDETDAKSEIWLDWETSPENTAISRRRQPH